MYIEFFGPAGSGKTTLSRLAAEFFRQQGARVYSRLEGERVYRERSWVGRLAVLIPGPLRQRVVTRFYCHFREREQLRVEQAMPELMAYVEESQRSRADPDDAARRQVMHYYENMKRQYAVFTALVRPGDVVIFEEGFANRVVQLHISADEKPDPARVRAYLDLVPRPDYLIFIDLPASVCMLRMMQRSPQNYTTFAQRRWLERYCANAEQAIRIAHDYLREKGWQIIKLENSQFGLSQAEAEIREKLGWLTVSPAQ